MSVEGPTNLVEYREWLAKRADSWDVDGLSPFEAMRWHEALNLFDRVVPPKALIGDVPHNRTDTSRLAARSLGAARGTLQEQVVAAIRDKAGGLTCGEVEVAVGGAHQSVSARIRELAQAGVLAVSGAKRRNPGSGRLARVYVWTGVELEDVQ